LYDVQGVRERSVAKCILPNGILASGACAGVEYVWLYSARQPFMSFLEVFWPFCDTRALPT